MLISFLAGIGIVGSVLATLLGGFLVYYKGITGAPRNLESTVSWLRNRSNRQNYKRRLTAFLDWVDDRVSKRETSLGILPTSASFAWSVGLLNFSLAFALAYPIFLILCTWIITGKAEIGSLTIFTEETRWAWRYIPFLLVIGAFSLFRYWVPQQKSTLSQLIVFVAIIGIAGAVSGAYSREGAVLIFVAAAIAFFISHILFQDSPKNQVFVTAGVLAIAFEVAAVVSAVVVEQPIIIIVVECALLTISLVLLIASADLRTRHGIDALFYTAIFALLFMMGIISSAISLKSNTSDISSAGMILFLGLLPLINALADFISIGATRFWMRRSALNPNHILRNMIGDAMVGIIIFSLLGITIIFVVGKIYPLTNEPLIDLQIIFDDLQDRQDRKKYWWIFILLFSTLIPTFLHLIIASAAAFMVAPKFLREWTANNLEIGGERPGKDYILQSRRGYFGLSAGATLSLAVPLLVAVYGFLYFPTFIDWAIHGFRTYAEWLEVIEPVQELDSLERIRNWIKIF